MGTSAAELAVDVRPGVATPSRTALGGALDVVREALADGFPPGAALAVVDRDGIAARAFGGLAVTEPEIPVAFGTIFDLASLTKLVVTVPLALALEERGAWGLDDPVARWLPGYPSHEISLWHCLTHCSGLPAWRPFYEHGQGMRAVQRLVYAERRERPLGEEVCYSDLNFMLLGWAAARCAGEQLQRAARRIVLEPLGMRDTRYRPPESWQRRIAATEDVWGIVHDENARALGGVAGHAGLFGPLADLARFVRALLRPDEHPVLSRDALERMTRRQTGDPPEVRGLGWQVQPFGMATGWPDDTYGHTGFTGTSLVVSPQAGLGVVLLTNAVHAGRRSAEIVALRRAFHSALAAGI